MRKKEPRTKMPRTKERIPKEEKRQKIKLRSKGSNTPAGVSTSWNSRLKSMSEFRNGRRI